MPLKSTSERRFVEMAERHLFVPFDELAEIEIRCQCGTGLVIPALANAPKLKSECPGCGRSLQDAAQAVIGFREFYSKAKEFSGLPKDDSNPVKAIIARSIGIRIEGD